MTQQQNITTLFIPDPNGGQPQLIKVMGKPGQVPFQVTSTSGTSLKTTTTYIKSATDQGQTTTAKLSTGQIITIPKQSLRSGQMVMPVKSPVRVLDHQGSGIRLVHGGSTSPVVIRTQTSTMGGPGTQQTLYYTPQQAATPYVQRQQSSQPVYVQHKQHLQQEQKPAMQVQMQQMLVQAQKRQMQQQSTPVMNASPPKSVLSTSILDHSGGARKRQEVENFEYGYESTKRRKGEKGGKGLRHFSMKVCEKVRAKGVTSYNEVADELVSEFTSPARCQSPTDPTNYDQKNIRRRVYDALNVLMAMNIISKEKKEIKWLGLPTNTAHECRKLERERHSRVQRINLKTQQLQDLILQQIAFKNLVERNRIHERVNSAPTPNSAIQLPFIIVNTSKKTVIDCSISNDKTEYLFNFDDTFEIHDDIEVLKRMGMALGLEKAQCSASDLEKAKSMVPKALESYVTDLALGVQAPNLNLTDLPPLELLEHDEELEAAVAAVEGGAVGGLSRHSSLGSLRHLGAASPSSFDDEEDDYDEDALEESDGELCD